MPHTATRPSRRADAQHNADKILDAAVACLGHNPYASVREIAQAAGVGRVTLYGHFSRETLVEAVMIRVLERECLPSRHSCALADRRPVPATSASPNGAANRPPGEWLRAGRRARPLLAKPDRGGSSPGEAVNRAGHGGCVLSVGLRSGPLATVVNGRLVARPVRTTAPPLWRRRCQLRRWARPVPGRTCLVGKPP
jgi:AcrR family transcriptional regulator